MEVFIIMWGSLVNNQFYSNLKARLTAPKDRGFSEFVIKTDEDQ